jgi:hypothetical protein
MQTKKRPGRPSRELLPGERVPMSFRVTPELKARMDRIAADSGRSVTQEVERLIEQALLVEKMAGTKVWRMTFEVLKAIDDATRGFPASPGEGLDNTANYMFAMTDSILALARLFPGEPLDDERHKLILLAIEAAVYQIKLSGGKE